MPAKPTESPCTEDGTVNGICIAGEFVLGSDEVGTPVRGVSVSGFRVRDFTRFGVVVDNAVDTTIVDTDVGASGLWGVAAFTVTDIRLVRDTSHTNGQGGFYVGDSPHANAVLDDLAAYGNTTSEGIGIFVRDASHGIVHGNRLEGNCTGLIAVDTGIRRGRRGLADRRQHRPRKLGRVRAERRHPAAALGPRHRRARHERHVDRGKPRRANTPSAEAPLSGGILLASSESVGGVDPSNTVVRGNVARANVPADLIHDGTGERIRVTDNRCQTSGPRRSLPVAAPRRLDLGNVERQSEKVGPTCAPSLLSHDPTGAADVHGQCPA